MMETSMYDENMMRDGGVKQLKSKMSLDFNSMNKAKKLNGLLSSPDLNICTLASPELERMIIQQNGMVMTPTPTQFIFPRNVTEEQDAYARGFIDALANLHNKNEQGSADERTNDSTDAPITTTTITTLHPSATQQRGSFISFENASGILGTADKTREAESLNTIEVPAAATITTLQPVTQPGATALTIAQSHVPAQTIPASSSSAFAYNDASLMVPTVVSSHHEGVADLRAGASPPQAASVPHQLAHMKEEPQTVPCYNSPPMSPIDMNSQERTKLHRKRERNRVAARRCRYRKLERIGQLEERVCELNTEKEELGCTARSLREEVARLKQQIMEHVNSGCKLMLNANVI